MITVSWQASQLILPLKVTPKGGRNCILPYAPGDNAIRIKVACPPEDGKANTAVLSLLAELLAFPKSRIELIQGDKSRQKRVALREITHSEARLLLDKLAVAMQTTTDDAFDGQVG